MKSAFLLPSIIVQALPDKHELIVDLLADDGEIIRTVLVGKGGRILGQVVGGHDGVTSLDNRIEGKTLTGVRRRDGVLRSLGLSRWIRCDPQELRREATRALPV